MYFKFLSILEIFSHPFESTNCRLHILYFFLNLIKSNIYNWIEQSVLSFSSLQCSIADKSNSAWILEIRVWTSSNWLANRSLDYSSPPSWILFLFFLTFISNFYSKYLQTSSSLLWSCHHMNRKSISNNNKNPVIFF